MAGKWNETPEYPTAAPVYADADHMAGIIGHARTADEAMAIYAEHFAGTGAKAVQAVKVCPERRGASGGSGPVDGWAPEIEEG
jgi:hypothetical protein